ncbi:LPXTG-motif cell wall anchor domain-containing protein [Secundilactobacillus malefermentans DSM 5705 = KCTC 3548]|nr:DUF5979 domain-containing protein [Secundilactobacillus malefermentans]KRM57106.1 LPXTG-motif cell wall anchor domain-containing protein [Secundilactobacillus malefermentans DSM 5705 = KCTC 3548]
MSGFKLANNEPLYGVIAGEHGAIANYIISVSGTDNDQLSVKITFDADDSEAAIENFGKGELTVNTEFNKDAGSIGFDFSQTEKIEIIPEKPQAAISKSGKITGRDTIEWTIDVKLDEDEILTNVVLRDILTTTNHEIVPGSFELVSGEAVPAPEDPNIEDDVLKFLSIKGPIQFKITTKSNTEELLSRQVYNNRISMDFEENKTDTPLEANASVARESFNLAKSNGDYQGDGVYKWDVTFSLTNVTDRADLANWTLSDSLTGPHQYFEEGTYGFTLKKLGQENSGGIDLKKPTITDGKSFSVGLEANGSFDNTSRKDLDAQYVLTYYTKFDGSAPGENATEGNSSLGNKITLSGTGHDGDDEGDEGSGSIGIGEKEATGINFEEKTVSWKISANTSEIDFDKLTIRENLPGYLTLDGDFVLENGKKEKLTNGIDYTIQTTPIGNDYIIEIKRNDLTKGQQINVSFTTKYNPSSIPADQKLKNSARITIDNSYTITTAEKEIPNDIYNESNKSGKLTISDNDYNQGKVRWSIGMNLHDRFDYKAGDQIVIDDVLNNSGTKYLSFENGEENFVLEKLAIESDGRFTGENLSKGTDYRIERVTDDGVERLIITLLKDTDFALRLNFDTKVNFMATGHTGNDWTFYNEATIEVPGTQLRKQKVSATVGHSNKDFFISKSAVSNASKNNGIVEWKSIINGGNQQLGNNNNIKITDTMDTGLKFVDEGEYRLSIFAATVEFREDNDGRQIPTYTESNQLKAGEDYELTRTSTGFEILISDDYQLNSPLILKYHTLIEGSGNDDNELKNTINISGSGIGGEASDTIKSDSHGFGNYTKFSAEITKVDASDPKKVLPGAVFKIQYAEGDNSDTPRGEYTTLQIDDEDVTATSDNQGIVHFNNLDKMKWYRLVEIESPSGYRPADVVKEFRFDRNADRGRTTLSYTVTNEKEEFGEISISKKVTNPVKDQGAFNFEIYAESKDDATDKLNGTFEGRISREGIITSTRVQLTFNEGKLVEISGEPVADSQFQLEDGEELLIQELETRYVFDITEITEEDHPYKTSVQVNRGDENIGTSATDVSIPKDAQATVLFRNVRGIGEFKLTKYTEGTENNKDKEFDFTITADSSVNIDGSYDIETASGTVKNGITFTNNRAEVQLRSGESVLIKELPEGAKLQATEADGQGNYHVSWLARDSNGKYSGNSKDADPVLISDWWTSTVDFTNSIPDTARLQIEKFGTGPIDEDQEFTFDVQAKIDGVVDTSVNGEFDTILERPNGNSKEGRIEFNKGRITTKVKLKAGEMLTILGLPVQEFQVSEEKPDGNYTTKWETSEDASGGGLVADEVGLRANRASTVTFHNHLERTSLEVEKQVTGQSIQNDLEKEFRFVLINTDNKLDEDEKDVVGYIGDKEVELNFTRRTTGGTWSEDFKLKHGEKLVIPDLPAGISMRAVEYGDDDTYETSWQVTGDGASDSGSTPTTAGNYRTNAFEMKDQGEYKVLFTNHKPSTDFELRKIITDAEDEELEETFKFNLLFTNKNVSVAGTYKTINQDNTNGEIIVDSKGNATIKKFGNEDSLRIIGLPVDTKVTVEEELTDEQLPYYKPSWSIGDADPVRGTTTSEISLEDEELTSVLYDNWYDPGDLFISKKLAGSYTTDDKQDSFKYTVTAYNSDSSVNTSFNYEFGMTVNRQNGSFEERIKFNSGVATVNLRADESVQIEKIPTNTLLRVTESNYAGYTPSYQINQGASVDGDTTSLITIVDDKVQEVDFTNRRPEVPSNGMLTLSKRVTGDNAETDRLFDFALNIQNADGSGFTGTLNYTFRTAFSSTLGQLPVINGNATMSLKHGDSVQFMLPTGTHYQITEDDYSGDGYTTSAVVNNTTVNDLTVSGTILENSANVVTYMNSMEEPEFPNEGGDEDDSEEAQAPTDESSSSPTVPNAGGSEGTGTSGTTGTGGGTAASGSGKGILPQTAEFLANNWLILLGGFILLNLIAWHIRNRYYKRSK